MAPLMQLHTSPFGLEPATKFTYDVDTETWNTTPTQIHILEQKVGEGGMRVCYRAEEVLPDGTVHQCVAKFFRPELRAQKDNVFNEAVIQYIAETFAQDFNRNGVPKKVSFLKCHVLRLDKRPGQPLCFSEPYMNGRFAKHNNNFGGNLSFEATPAAFSHFTYESSNHHLLVCDIQGVGNVYTDPQIHTSDGKGFGFGNLGQKGITDFLATHRCNDVCKLLGLPNVKPQVGHFMPVDPMVRFQFGGFGKAEGAHHPMEAILQMLERMPAGQGAFADARQSIGVVVGNHRAALGGAQAGSPPLALQGIPRQASPPYVPQKAGIQGKQSPMHVPRNVANPIQGNLEDKVQEMRRQFEALKAKSFKEMKAGRQGGHASPPLGALGHMPNLGRVR